MFKFFMSLAIFLAGCASGMKLTNSQKILNELCEKGDMPKCHELGLDLHNGGRINDATTFYTRGCENNFPQSCHNLGNIISDTNKSQALAYYTKSCALGIAESCYFSGVMTVELGRTNEAINIFSKSCNRGMTKSCNDLGVIYEKQGSINLAMNFYKKSCDAGNPISCNNLGFIYADKGQNEKAQKAFEFACKNGVSNGCNNVDRIAVSSDCIDSKYWPFEIVQKIDNHTYEVVAQGSNLIAPKRMLLKTKKAVFTNVGHPYGVKVKNTYQSKSLTMQNGFSRNYGVYEECGLMDLPKELYPTPGAAFRSRLPSEN